MSNFNYQYTTQVPNDLFDVHLAQLTFSELKVYLHIIRKTHGFVLKNGQRKKRDRIAHSQFIKVTGISRRSLPSTIQSLITKHLISVTDYHGDLLHTPKLRKGKMYLYYAPLCSQTKSKRVKSKKSGRQSDWDRVREITNSRN